MTYGAGGERTRGRCVAMYEYGTATKRRFENKSFDWGRWKDGLWIKLTKEEKERVRLYRADELDAADPERELWITEGEKDCDRLRSLGFLATTPPHGASGRWLPEYTKTVERFARVTKLEDNDDPGRQHADKVAHALHGAGVPVRIVAFPEMPVGSDVSNWLDLGRTAEDLIDRSEQTPFWEPHMARAIPETTSAPRTASRDATILTGRHSHLIAMMASLRNANLSDEAIRAAIEEENYIRFAPPLPDREVEGIARWDPNRQPVRAFTDLGNAETFADHHSGRILFTPGIGWLHWDGARWARDEDGEAVRLAWITVRALGARAEQLTDRTIQEPLRVHAHKSEQEPRLNALLSLAKKEVRLLERVDRLDFDPYKIAAPNGTICLRSGDLIDADPEDRITRMTAVEYEPTANSALWDSFLREQIPDDEVRAYVQREMGAALISPKRERIIFLNGPGGSGKGTFLSALQGALGEYAKTTDPDVFSDRGSAREAQLEMARLAGRRIVLIPELGRKVRLAMRLLKQISGGDHVRAREHYQQAFDFKPTFSLIFATNYTPEMDSVDTSTDRRIVVIPFPNAVPVAQQDPSLKDRLCHHPDHRAAVLAWIVAGARLFVEGGERLEAPKVSRERTEAWKEANDPLLSFFRSEVVFEPEATVVTAELKREYEGWCVEAGQEPFGWNKLADRLRDLGCSPQRTMVSGGGKRVQTRVWRGLRLKTSGEHAQTVLDFSPASGQDGAS